tara:strand:- start:162 stop:485 length:324 start_codon:yes stop_codon:yes gene_type:complete
MEFICSQCGACCKRTDALKKFGLPIKKDGSCGHLKNNKCSIYDKRPDVCSVYKVGKKIIKKHNLDITMKDWYIWNSKACNVLIKEDKLDKKYLIDITKYNLNTNKER